jgi:hypothetical protein
MEVRLSALHIGSPLPPRKIPVLISIRGRVDLRGIMRLEGLGQLKNSVFEPATFRLVAQYLNKLHHLVPQAVVASFIKIN